MTSPEKIAAMAEASKIVIALIQGNPGVFIAANADTAAERTSKAYAAIYSQIQKSVDG